MVVIAGRFGFKGEEMELIDLLSKNKGTISSELGKQLAKQIIDGNSNLIEDVIELSTFKYKNKKEKNIRAGAAKTVECVAEIKPEFVAAYLDRLILALEVDEAQTRWMIIRTFGFCAHLNIESAIKAIPFAQKYIREKKEGQLCLVSSADIFLGDFGSCSNECKNEVFKILIESSDSVIKNEHNWILESFIKIAKYFTIEDKKIVIEIADEFRGSTINKTSKLCDRLIKICR